MKRLIAIILCLILTFGLVACGNTPPEEMTQPTETTQPTENGETAPSGPAAVVGDVNQINKFKLGEKVYTIDTFTTDMLNEIGFKTESGVWAFMCGGLSLGGTNISNGKESIQYKAEEKALAVIGFTANSPDVELYSQIKVGMTKSDFVKKIKGMDTKLIKWMDDQYFCIVYGDATSMIAKIENSKVTTIYLAVNSKCGISNAKETDLDAVNKQYFEEQYSQNNHGQWSSYGKPTNKDVDTKIKLMGKEFKFEELKYQNLIDLGYKPTNSFHNLNGVMMFREFVHENGSSLLVVDNKDGIIEALMVETVPGIEDLNYEKGKVNCDLTIFGSIKVGSNSKDCAEILQVDIDLESMIERTELIGDKASCEISHRVGTIENILLINRTIFPTAEPEQSEQTTEATENTETNG